MTENEDSGTPALDPKNVDIEGLDRVLRATETPNQRLFAFIAMRTVVTRFTTEFLKEGKISAESAKWWRDRLDKFDRNVPSNFIDTLAALYAASEEWMHDANSEMRALISQLRPYLHRFAFNPPTDAFEDDAPEIGDDLRLFAAFVNEFHGETDRGAALIGAALVSNRLRRLLSDHLLTNEATEKLLADSSESILGTFNAQAQMCYALGLITEIEYKECGIIRRVRNEFAHQLHGLTFTNTQIADWCGNLKAVTYPTATPRERFVNSVITLCMVLWYRPAHAAPFKAQSHKWPWHLSTGGTGLLR
jgi:hypothetical protein